MEQEGSGAEKAPVSQWMGGVWTFLGWMLVVVLGGGYGALAYRWLRGQAGPGGASGLMLMSFLAAVPFAIGVLVTLAARSRRSVGDAAGLSLIANILFVLAAATFLREGVICIAMAMPLVLAFGLFGAVLTMIVDAVAGERGPKLLSLALLAPFAAAPLEQHMVSDTARQTVERSVVIDAPPDVVWRQINFPLDIKPEELGGGWAYRIGVPYPIEARTLSTGVGGKRELTWQRGVHFGETISAWEPPRRIAWTYDFRADSFPPGSFDEHVVIGGRYFNLEHTAYTLTPQAGGTRLDIVVGTSVTTHFNWYAGWLARLMIGDTAETILDFYKVRSEAATRSG